MMRLVLSFVLLTLVQSPRPVVAQTVRKKRVDSVERRAARTTTEDVGLQATRLNRTVSNVGKDPKCPTVPVASATPAPAVVAEEPEPKYADVMGENGKTFKVSVVPKSKLAQIYDEMKNPSEPNEPKLVWTDSCLCKERAHFAGDKLARKMNLETGKLMAVTGTFGMGMTPKLPTGRSVNWPYHVANFIMVEEEPGKPPVQYALDPGLFPKAPVPTEEWRQALVGLGDGGWKDTLLGRGRIRDTNRFTWSPADSSSYVDAYPRIEGAAYSNLRHVTMRMYDNKGVGKCNGRI